MSLRTAIYVRVSTDDQRDSGYSIDSQIRELTNYCKKKKYDIVDIYNEIASYKLIFTKLDETSSYGNLLNIKLYADADLSYVTIGQNVPDDIEVFDTQKIVKQLLGGK